MDVSGSIDIVRVERHILHVSRERQIRQVLPSVHAEGVWGEDKNKASVTTRGLQNKVKIRLTPPLDFRGKAAFKVY